MSRTVKVVLTDAVYEAAAQRAVIEGGRTTNDPGIASVLRHALVPFLSQNGHKMHVLRMTDAEYQEHLERQKEDASERSEEERNL